MRGENTREESFVKRFCSSRRDFLGSRPHASLLGVLDVKIVLELMKDVMVTGEAPPVGTQMIRSWLLNWDGDEVPDFVAEWVDRRQQVLLDGADVIEALEERHRTPNYHDVVEGTANFPPWHGDPDWTMVCFFPWSEKYEQALEQVKSNLVEQTSGS